MTFSVDRVLVPAKIRGDFFKLNLKREVRFHLILFELTFCIAVKLSLAQWLLINIAQVFHMENLPYLMNQPMLLVTILSSYYLR